MLTLETSHGMSLLIAFVFAIFLHFSLSGFFKNARSYLLSFIFFPFVLMGLTLFVPQVILQILSYLLILGGFVLGLKNLSDRYVFIKEKISNMGKKEKWCLGLTGLYLICFFMDSTILINGGSIQDSLVYHLAGPKEWTLFLEGAKFTANNPMTFTTSYYDYFYYFIFLLLKPFFVSLAPLPTTQYEFLSYTVLLHAQLFTSFIALIYVPYLIIKLCGNLGLYKYLAVLFIYGLRLITWSWTLPKNDIFPFLCFLVAIDYFNDRYIKKENNKEIFPLLISATVVGIGTTSKLTNAYVVIFSFIFLFAFYFKELKNFVKGIGLTRAIFLVGLGMGVGSSIFLIRNVINTGNPFFPIDKFGFANVYISTYAHRPDRYYMPVDWIEAFAKLIIHVVDQPQLLFVLLSAFFLRVRALAIFYVAMVLYMSKMNGDLFTFRMTNIYLVLALILFILVVKEISKHEMNKGKKAFTLFLICFVLIFAKFQPEKLLKYPVKFYSQSTEESIRTKVDHWDILLKTNLENRENKTYVFSPDLEIFPYFSRYPFISKFDSVPQYRYDYFKNN